MGLKEETELPYPGWMNLANYVVPLSTAVIVVLQRGAVVPPSWGLALAAAAALPWLLELVGVELPVPVFSAIVFGAVLALVSNPVNGDAAPFFLIFLIARVGIIRPRAEVVAVTLASSAVMVSVELAGRYTGAFVWVLAFGLIGASCFAFQTQFRLFEQERAAQAGLAERAAAEERQRIAREIHDVIAHSLAVTMLHLTGARLALRRDPAEAEEALLQAERLGRESLAEIRRTVGLLAPEGTGTAAPMPSAGDIPNLVSEFEAAGLAVDFELSGDPCALPPATGLGLYRVAQESLSNVVRHAPGTHTTMSLRVGDDVVSLRVRNRLASTIPSPNNDGGLGVRGMQERVTLLGGVLRAGPDGDSWCVDVELPRMLETA
ncbi:MAG TPA: histidine kinase [Acidimicrobiia bacterium]|nr:histidine kinase [Acidimicrobiia bacterium]